MKKALKTVKRKIHYYKNGERIDGAPSEVSGNLTDISGNLTGISGNIDDCEITEEERRAGINVNDLILE